MSARFAGACIATVVLGAYAAACGWGGCSSDAEGYECTADDEIDLSVTFDEEAVHPEVKHGSSGCDESVMQECLVQGSGSQVHLGFWAGFDEDVLPLGETSAHCNYHKLRVNISLLGEHPIRVGDEFTFPLAREQGTVTAEIRANPGNDDTCGGSEAPTAVYRVAAGTLRVVTLDSEGREFEWSMSLELSSAPVEGVPQTIELSNVRQPCSVKETTGC